jgi:tetratricopeptide (TPR) repeat protein
MLDKISFLIKLIGIAITISLLPKITTAKTLTEVSQTTKLVPTSASKLNNRQHFSPIAQNIPPKAKAQEYNRLATQKLLNGDYQGALIDYNRAIQLDPNYAKAYNSRGTVKMIGFKDYPGALADYNRAIQLDPNLSAAYTSRGTLKALESKDYRGALVEYNRAIELNPNDIDAYTSRAATKYRYLKDRSGGIADLQKAAQLLQQAGKQEEAQRITGIVKQWQLETKKSGSV